MLKFRRKEVILYLAAALIVFGCIFGLYQINSRIPDGIFLSGVSREEIEEAYSDLCGEITPYEPGDFSGAAASGLLITPQEGAEQILPFTLKERYAGAQGAYVRDLATERKMRLAAFTALACVVVFLFLNPLLFALIGENGKDYHFLLRTAEFFVLCILVSRKGALPSVCVPEKFIYFRQWWEKCAAYFEELKKLGKIPCAAYQECAALQWGLFVLLAAGMAVFVWARILGKNK